MQGLLEERRISLQRYLFQIWRRDYKTSVNVEFEG